MPEEARFEVIVIGLGIVGAATVHELAKRGVQTLGLEQFDIMHGHGSSGGFSRLFRMCYYEHPDYVPLLKRSLEGWHRLNALAEERGDSEIFYLTGGVLIGPPNGMLVGRSYEAAKKYDLAHEMIDADELRRRFPQFTVPDDFGALYEPQMGFGRPSRTIALCIEEALRHGATIHAHEPVKEWSVSDDGSHVTVRTPSSTYVAEHVIFAAGPWAPQLVGDLGVRLDVTRQVFAWVWPNENPDQFRLGAFPPWAVDDLAGSLYYGFPMMHDNPGLKLAHHSIGEQTTADMIDRRIRPDDEETFRPVLRHHIPSGNGDALAIRTCLYTNTPDGHFIVDRHPDAPDRVSICCGLSGHGFKFAPVLAESVADLATIGSTEHPIDFLSLQRFEA